MTDAEKDNLTRWKGQKPFYEVYYLKFNNVEKQTAVWLRYTLLTPLSRPPEASLWGIYFDAKNPARNFFIKETYPATALNIGKNSFSFSIGESLLSQEGARGKIANASHTLEWDLRFSEGVSLTHFPSLLYRLPLPKTKFLAPFVTMRVGGGLKVDGVLETFEGLPGHEAHLWGTSQAARWAWANCNTFEEDPEAFFEGLTAQIALGKILSPPLSLFFFRIDGKVYGFNRLHRWFRNKSRYDSQSWHLEAQSGNFSFIVDIEAFPENQMKVPYEDPDGSRRLCLNTKLADIHLDLLEKISGKWTFKKRLTARKSAAFEVVETV